MVELNTLSVEERRAKSALLLLVPGLMDLIEGYRREFTADGATVPPHFTLMFPFLAPSEITPEALQRIADVATAVPCFDYTLSRVDRFPGAVMFLAPDAPAPFIDLIERFRHAFPGVSPYWDKVDQIVPHLTLADESLVDSTERLDDIERAVTAHLPIHREAREVVLLQELRPSPAPWEVRSRFSLAPSSARGSNGM